MQFLFAHLRTRNDLHLNIIVQIRESILARRKVIKTLSQLHTNSACPGQTLVRIWTRDYIFLGKSRVAKGTALNYSTKFPPKKDRWAIKNKNWGRLSKCIIFALFVFTVLHVSHMIAFMRVCYYKSLVVSALSKDNVTQIVHYLLMNFQPF